MNVVEKSKSNIEAKYLTAMEARARYDPPEVQVPIFQIGLTYTWGYAFS